MLYRKRSLTTKTCSIDTPVFFPVRNVGKRSKDNTPNYTDMIPELNTALVNTAAIRSREYLIDKFQKGESLHEVLDIDAVIFADSGGFDIYKDESKASSITPTNVLDTQQKMDADIYGTLDIPLSRDERSKENQRRINKGIEYAVETSEKHEGDALLFASVHGYDPETVINSIEYLEKNGDFDGYALGSLVPIRSKYKKVTKLILAARTATDKHLHVYGLGGLVYQPILLYLGVDSFDSSAFIRQASHRTYYVPGLGGEEFCDIETLDYLPCPCPVCKNNELSEIRKSRDMITKHNLWALTIELRKFKYMHEAGEDIENYIELRLEGNPSMKRVFKSVKQQVRRLI